MKYFDSEKIATEAVQNGEDPLSSVVFQALGAASVCWDDDGIFESERAKAIGDDVVEYLRNVHQQS